MRILVILVLTPAFAAGVVAGAVGLVGRDVPVAQQPTTLVWGDRVFASRHDFAVWLESRGASYKIWAKRHPAAAGVFAPRSGRRFAAAAEARSAEVASSRERRTQAGRAALLAATLLAIVLAIAALRPRLRRVNIAIQLPRRSRHVGTGDTVRKPRLRRHAAIALRPRPGSMSLRAPAANTLRQLRGLAVRERWNGVAGLALAGAEQVHAGAGAVVVRRLLRRYLPTIAFYGISALLALALGASIALYLN